MESTISESISEYQPYIDLILEKGSNFGIDLVIALLVLLIGVRVTKLITNLAVKAMHRQEIDTELTTFMESLIYWGMTALVVVAAMGQLGVQTASFIAVLGAAGLAIGLALQGSLSNFAAGVLILILRPVNVDDYVEVAGEAGTVKSIRIFTTELRTTDNKCVVIPNSRVLASNIINYSSTGTRRVDLVFGIGYEDDIDKARDVIKQVLAKDDRILTDKEAFVAVSQLADSSVNFVVRPWVKTEDYWAVHCSLTEQIKKQFDANDITIPYPQMTVHKSA
jgi:small conductance mechanosensitive channel